MAGSPSEHPKNQVFNERPRVPVASPKVTVLICTLNEEQNIAHVLKRIPAVVSEVLVVDGHSVDRTAEVAKEAYPGVRVLTQPGRGKGDALRYGIQQATGDVIITLDADGSMNPDEGERFVIPLLNGYDFVKGSRFLAGGGTEDMPRHRRFGNWVFTRLVNLLYGVRYTDLCYGYNAFWRKAVQGIRLQASGFDVETELNIQIRKRGLRVVEVPSFEKARQQGKGKLGSFRDGAKILRTIFRERFRRPL